MLDTETCLATWENETDRDRPGPSGGRASERDGNLDIPYGRHLLGPKPKIVVFGRFGMDGLWREIGLIQAPFRWHFGR